MAGPLQGIRVIEMAGLGPVPLAGLMLSEMGAEVVRVERINATRAFLDMKPEHDLDRHGRRILRVDLKSEAGRDLLLRMGGKADILMEGFRPGVMERLGLGPQDFAARNPALIYGRMTGFGQEGPLSKRAGHDLTYLALSGVLSMIGPRDEKPVPPLNLVGDYGGGTMFLLTGLLAALIERGRTGKGQVVDAAMVDGASMLALSFFGFMKAGIWQEKRGENLLDSGAPFYDTYETADGGQLAVACLEPQFFAEFSRLLPLEEPFASNQYDRKLWPEMRKAIAARLKTKTRDEWDALFAPTDACVAPVLSLCEAPEHPHNRARQAHVKVGDMMRPAPAPRFSTDKASVAGIAEPVKDLSAFGIDANELEELVQSGVIGD
ncbi:CaiB/BaiF CoA transferase family protein [Nitratireductor basaltis]|uniref:L-carnitine dehydratase/bile acid-inducible protein F n=1 Tax=Nitratireductor basaltis TaxID=472175 RepID=A0A084U8Z8_9HYPH|nr:CaiB/BaiF CoA-transferase family protein [Nitratireductor basaltis]KFB09434.1 L-carnitine dehydratase/bile acid-inducible protein F [Nitratireductor basaltis]